MRGSSFRIPLLFISTLVSAWMAYLVMRYNHKTTQELAQRAEVVLKAKEEEALTYLNAVSHFLKYQTPHQLFFNDHVSLSELYKEEGISIYVYRHDSLCFWSDNQPAIDVTPPANKSKAQLLKIRNGWYECIRQEDTSLGKYIVLALIAIKPEYDFENKYLSNRFSSWLELPENTTLITPASYAKHAVHSKFGMPLFEIYRKDGIYYSKKINDYACLLALFSIILFFTWVYGLLKSYLKDQKKTTLVFAFLLLAVRTLMIYLKLPTAFYHSDFYDATVFANASSFYFSFLGDILINAFLLFLVSGLMYKTSHEVTKRNFWHKVCFFSVAFCVVVYFTHTIRRLIESLVNNTTITYDISDLFNYKGYSLVGLFSIAFFIFSFYLVLEKIISIGLKEHFFTQMFFILFFSFNGIAVFTIRHLGLSMMDYLWSVPLIVVIYYLRKYKASFNFINIGLIILIFSAMVSHFFVKYEKLNKRQTYDALALTLTDRQDVIAENEFNRISHSIKSDIKLKNLLAFLPYSSDEIEQRLRQVHFSGYFERYDMVMSLFKNDSSSVFHSVGDIYAHESYFKQQIQNESYQTISRDLYFIGKQKRLIRYVAEIEIEGAEKYPNKTCRLYVQLEPKIAINDGAFLDLLLDKFTERKLESRQLSYAVYESGKLMTSYGDYQYPLLMNASLLKQQEDDTYEHYDYFTHDKMQVVITDKKNSYWQQFTATSYVFVFFSILVLACILFNSLLLEKKQVFNSLHYRIQFVFAFIVVISFTGVLMGTIWVVSSQQALKNQKELISKSQSVLKELQQTINQQEILDPSCKDYTTYSLKKLAQLFGSDISLFDHKGILFSTSQPAIYEQGLISKLMNPMAYAVFLEQLKTNYSHKETIGQLDYLSAYIPFYNKNDKLLGYINLPYYAKQKDLKKELSVYLTTLINIYTVLIVITTLIALLVSNFLTKPLRLIKQQISDIKFGAYNEALIWKSNDEVGKLVEEYNAMLVKLEENSELLAKSERESAWREMAKQVAHEIKNPLTPMRLNIQHLQRMIESNPDDMKERVDKVSTMLIEQIDTLSHIANEFSNFAKLPHVNIELVNLFEILQNVTQLFKQNTNCDIHLMAHKELYVMADKEQCLRLFTNLLKNAEQSIPIERKGTIELGLQESEDRVVAHIKDNGCGISEELTHKLFTPNFTTKSTGMGLGLAMVKNSMISFGGTVEFETTINVGTTFKLLFPKVTQ